MFNLTKILLGLHMQSKQGKKSLLHASLRTQWRGRTFESSAIHRPLTMARACHPAKHRTAGYTLTAHAWTPPVLPREKPPRLPYLKKRFRSRARTAFTFPIYDHLMAILSAVKLGGVCVQAFLHAGKGTHTKKIIIKKWGTPKKKINDTG